MAVLVLLSGVEKASAKPALEPMHFCFAPLGKADRRLLVVAQKGVEHLYGASTSVLPARPLPSLAYYKPRKRYRAEKLLDFLRDDVMPKHGCDIVIGITGVDISTTKDQHEDWGILGLGSIGGIVGVVSSFRMKRGANIARQKRRMVSVVNHEVGHVLGAPHGGEPGCLMNDAQGTIRTVDQEHGLLCNSSRKLIEAHTQRALPMLVRFNWEKVLE